MGSAFQGWSPGTKNFQPTGCCSLRDAQNTDTNHHAADPDGFVFPVLFVIHTNCRDEGDDDRRSTQGRDDRDVGSVVADRGEVLKVRDQQQNGDHRDRPSPLKSVGCSLSQVPVQHERRHDDQQIDRKPRLYGGRSKLHPLQQPFVIQRAERTEQCGDHHAANPAVAVELDAFLLADQREHVERAENDEDSSPLSRRRTFSHERHGDGNSPERTGGSNRRRDRHRQMLQRERSKDPRTAGDDGLQEQQAVLFQRERFCSEPFNGIA